jgi:mono/diheme cytochrome c family protein
MTGIRVMLSGVVILILFVLNGCDYGRMYDQDVIKTYGQKMPEMDARTIPVRDGFQALVTADPKRLENPLEYSKLSVEQGAQAYSYYCIHCHGPKADGNGTVGQSFVPLPADLSSQPVQGQSDGELYAKIRLGFKRHPQLFTTVSEEDTWAVVIYIRSISGTRVAPSSGKATWSLPLSRAVLARWHPRVSPWISIKGKSG